MGLFGNKKCEMCSAKGGQLWPAEVASGAIKQVCKKCKGMMGGKKRAR